VESGHQDMRQVSPMEYPMLLVCGYGSRGAAVAGAFVERGLEPAQIAIIDLFRTGLERLAQGSIAASAEMRPSQTSYD
jgi:hypothetical protein